MKKILFFIAAMVMVPSLSAMTLVFGDCDADACVKRFKDVKKHARNHISANTLLGDMYLHGYGTNANEDEALEAYEKAARWGSLYGKYKAGLLLISTGDAEGKEEGLTYLRDAAKRGHHNAVYFMGEILSNAEYGLENIAEADKWLAVVVEAKHDVVPQTLARLRQEGRLNQQHFPDTLNALSKTDIPIPKAGERLIIKPGRTAPQSDKYEVIEVNGPQLAELIDFGIEYYEEAPSDLNKVTTGTRIRGRSCADRMNGCGSAPLDQFMRYYRQFIL